jgi:competence transcription factor ComK
MKRIRSSIRFVASSVVSLILSKHRRSCVVVSRSQTSKVQHIEKVKTLLSRVRFRKITIKFWNIFKLELLLHLKNTSHQLQLTAETYVRLNDEDEFLSRISFVLF